MASSGFWFLLGLFSMVAATARSALVPEGPGELAIQGVAEAIEAVELRRRDSASTDTYINALRAIADLARAAIELSAIAENVPPVGIPEWLNNLASMAYPQHAAPSRGPDANTSRKLISSNSKSDSGSKDVSPLSEASLRVGRDLIKLLAG